MAFKYQDIDIVVSFAPDAFAQVLGIPDEGKEVDRSATKMSDERKTQLLQWICRSDLLAAEWGEDNYTEG